MGAGRVAISTRERLMALEPHGKGLFAWSLRTIGEVRDAAEVFDAIPDVRVDPAMVQIAKKIIEQQEGPFDPPPTFTDRYEEALRKLIAEKEKGHQPVAVREPEDTDIVDRMAALRASLAGKKGKSAGEGKSAPKAVRRRAATSAK